MTEFYTLALITLLAAMTPGPDFAVVVKHGLKKNARYAYFTSLGIGLGILIHSAYCITGLAIIIVHSTLLFKIIQYLGAAYLLYLGVKSLLYKGSSATLYKEQKKQNDSYWSAFRDGFFVNILNPKCTLFMLSIFTLVINPKTPHLIQIFYGLEIATITTAWFFLLSHGLQRKFVKNKIHKAQNIIMKITGIVLIFLGISVVLH